MASKDEELESLETSNAMLRKQLISSINNEESSRKEVLEVRSKSGSMIFHNQRSKVSTTRSNLYSHALDKRGKVAQSMMINSQDLKSKNRIPSREKETRDSLVKEITRLNNQLDDHNMPEK